MTHTFHCLFWERDSSKQVVFKMSSTWSSLTCLLLLPAPPRQGSLFLPLFLSDQLDVLPRVKTWKATFSLRARSLNRSLWSPPERTSLPHAEGRKRTSAAGGASRRWWLIPQAAASDSVIIHSGPCFVHASIRVAVALATREKSSTVQTLMARESSTVKKHISLLRFSYFEARFLPGSPRDKDQIALHLLMARPAKIRAVGKRESKFTVKGWENEVELTPLHQLYS